MTALAAGVNEGSVSVENFNGRSCANPVMLTVILVVGVVKLGTAFVVVISVNRPLTVVLMENEGKDFFLNRSAEALVNPLTVFVFGGRYVL